MHIEEIIEALKLAHRINTMLYYENLALRTQQGNASVTAMSAHCDDLKKINDLVSKLSN